MSLAGRQNELQPPSGEPLTVAYIAAGAGGMICGSCLNDNTLARELHQLGVDIHLIPMYTPIRTDEPDFSDRQVFFGGINVYLQQKIPLFRYLPAPLDRFLDQPWLIRWATSRGMQTSAKQLGALTVSMLKGSAGHQRKEVRRLCDWLGDSVQPQLVNFSNMLIAGCARTIRQKLDVPIVVTLQGDDVFLDDLIEPYKAQAFEELYRIGEDIDGFIVHSDYYAQYMCDYMRIPAGKVHVVPLGIHADDFAATSRSDHPVVDGAADASASRPKIGYLARLSREKGLHLLIDAFIELRAVPGLERAELHIAGWLGPSNRDYAQAQFKRLHEAGLDDAFHYHGTVTRSEKIAFLGAIDVLSVPTVYPDPKGLFVLEALAHGVPVVQPRHGAFPELIGTSSAGILVEPNDSRALAAALGELLLADQATRSQMGAAGFAHVTSRHTADLMAVETLEVFRQLLEKRHSGPNVQMDTNNC